MNKKLYNIQTTDKIKAYNTKKYNNTIYIHVFKTT